MDAMFRRGIGIDIDLILIIKNSINLVADKEKIVIELKGYEY